MSTFLLDLSITTSLIFSSFGENLFEAGINKKVFNAVGEGLEIEGLFLGLGFASTSPAIL